MKKILFVFTLNLICLALLAQNVKQRVSDPDSLESDYYSQLFDISLRKDSANLRLYSTVNEWIGTPYRYGGDSRSGIDCSGFTGKIFNSVYNLSLAQNSAAIFDKSIPLNRSELKEGDFVFFKISKGRVSHVGVYLGNDKFAHASVSRGVMISDLNEAYYKRYFYKGGRMPDAIN